jgi:hypothetical protein
VPATQEKGVTYGMSLILMSQLMIIINSVMKESRSVLPV